MNSGVVPYILISIGVAFDLVGALGLLRLPDVYNRLQAATKCVTLGTCLILVGVLVHSGWNAMGVKALLAAVFVLWTSPTGSHALARGGGEQAQDEDGLGDLPFRSLPSVQQQGLNHHRLVDM